MSSFNKLPASIKLHYTPNTEHKDEHMDTNYYNMNSNHIIPVINDVAINDLQLPGQPEGKTNQKYGYVQVMGLE